MAEIIKKLSSSEMETISKILGECVTGSQLTDFFQECRILDTSTESTKWRRIYRTFLNKQEEENCSNSFFVFVKKILAPARYITGENGNYDLILAEINKPLMLLGLQMTQEGKLVKVPVATTISEVERRTRSLVNELQKRHIHEDVLTCCKEEYLQENYFHAVFEAAKSLSEKVREKTGIQEDGTRLFDQALAVNNPKLVMNALQTYPVSLP